MALELMQTFWHKYDDVDLEAILRTKGVILEYFLNFLTKYMLANFLALIVDCLGYTFSRTESETAVLVAAGFPFSFLFFTTVHIKKTTAPTQILSNKIPRIIQIFPIFL